MGTGGFGYDSLFIPNGQDLSFAQMEAEEKNKISHRKRALFGAIHLFEEGGGGIHRVNHSGLHG